MSKDSRRSATILRRRGGVRPTYFDFVSRVVLCCSFAWICQTARRGWSREGTDREDRRANPQVAGIIVQDPLQDLGMHQNTVEECSGHGISGEWGRRTCDFHLILLSRGIAI